METEKKLKEVICEAAYEINESPEDSIQDIFNECFEKWDVNLRMTHNFDVVDFNRN